VQITLTIGWGKIEALREETIKELAKNVEIPGFRKGNAPIEKAREKLDAQFVIEKTLSQILPKMFADSISANKIRPAMYPRFELLSAKEGEDWQVRATTAEIPEFELGDYNTKLKAAAATDSIWTPEKGDPKAKKELTQEQKENVVVKFLQESYDFAIPAILTEEEVNSRLASLLERLERLGLSLESYLASIKKTAEELRHEYGHQAEKAIRLDILMGRIAEKEGVTASDEEVSGFINTANTAGGAQKIADDQKSTVSAFLTKRKVLEKLAGSL
jgi:trigger factor